jgi:hypothetical protein
MNERLTAPMQTADDHDRPAPDFADAEAQIAAEKHLLGELARQRDPSAIERLAVNAVRAVEAEGKPMGIIAHQAALRLCDELGQNQLAPLPTAPGRRRFDRVIFDACVKAHFTSANGAAAARRTA